MNPLTKTLLWLSRKTGFDTVTAGEWLQRNGYYRLSQNYGFGVVSQERALQSTAVYGCVKILGEDTGSLPLFVYRRRKQGDGRDVADDLRLYELLHDAPNPETSAVEFREALTANAALTGSGYAKIVRDKSGEVLALWQLMPYCVEPARTSRGLLYYKVTEDGKQKDYAREDIFHLRGFGFDGVSGANVLNVARDAIGLTLQQVDYASQFFQRDHTPGIILEHPQKLGPEGIAGVKKAWRDSVKSHDVAVTQEGMKVTKVGQTNEESQLVEQRTFQIAEVCRLFRMPPHKLQELSRATFSNIEHLNIQYFTETLRPWLVRWEQAITRCLIPVKDRKTIFAEHSIEGLLRGDFKTQSEGFAKYLEKGVVSINEVRALLNLNPVAGGDEHFIQLNMAPVDGAAERADASLQRVA